MKAREKNHCACASARRDFLRAGFSHQCENNDISRPIFYKWKFIGKRSCTEVLTIVFMSGVVRYTGMSLNSARVCRHMPHGDVILLSIRSAEMAIALN